MPLRRALWNVRRLLARAANLWRRCTTKAATKAGQLVARGFAEELREELDELEEEWAAVEAEGRAFDAVIIETTGVATPAPIIQLFFADQEVRRQCRLDGESMIGWLVGWLVGHGS